MAEETSDGKGIERAGGDPTVNVRELVVEAIKRQDDLRHKEEECAEAALASLQALIESKLEGIAHEFVLVEDRRKEQKLDTKTAVDAAMAASELARKEQALTTEKALTKSETGVAEQSRAQNAIFAASLKSVTDMLTDTKDRVGKIENIKLGVVENRTEHQSNLGVQVAVFMAALSLIGVLVNVILNLNK